MIAGAHISSAGGLHNVPARAAAIGSDGVQVFIQSARTWKPTAHKPEDLAVLRAARESGEVQYIACHAIYFINLATDEPELLKKSRAALLNTIDVANAIAADGIVLHVGSHKGRGLEATLPQIVKELQTALNAWMVRGSCSRIRLGLVAPSVAIRSSWRASSTPSITRDLGCVSIPATPTCRAST